MDVQLTTGDLMLFIGQLYAENKALGRKVAELTQALEQLRQAMTPEVEPQGEAEKQKARR